jgi:hypothetical protein
VLDDTRRGKGLAKKTKLTGIISVTSHANRSPGPKEKARLIRLIRRRAAQINAVRPAAQEGGVSRIARDIKRHSSRTTNTQGGAEPHQHTRAGSRNSSTRRSSSQNSESSQNRQIEVLQRIDENLRRLRQIAEARRQSPATFTQPE